MASLGKQDASLLAAVATMAVWGANFPLTKYILDHLGVGAFLFLRFVVMLPLGFGLLLIVYRRHLALALPRREDLARFVAAENGKGKDRPVFVGHNAVFDWSYVAYYYAHFGMENPFGYKGLDTKSLAMGKLGVAWRETSKETLEKVLSLPKQDPAQIHRADYDAHYQALILQALLDLDTRKAAR